MKLKKYRFSNIGPYGKDNIIHFDTLSYPLAVFGINQSSDGYGSNGSGKSFLFNGIYWTITGKMVKNLPISDLIRIGKDGCEGELILEHNNSEITIQRSRNLSNESNLSVLVDGVDKSLRTNTLTQNYLYSLLGLNHKFLSPKLISVGLFNTIYLSLASVRYSFLSSQMEPRDKMEVLASYLGIVPLDLCLKKTKEDFSILDKEEKEVAARVLAQMSKFDCVNLESLEGILRTYRESLKELEDSVKQKEESLSAHKKILDLVDKYKIGVDEIRTNLNRLESRRDGLNESHGEEIKCDVEEKDRERIEKNISNVLKDLESDKNKLSSSNNTLTTLKRSLKSSLKCPSCDAHLSPVFESGILHGVTIFENDECMFEIGKLESDIQSIKSKISNREEQLEDNRHKISKLDKIKSRKDTQDKIDKLEVEVSEVKKKYKETSDECVSSVKKLLEECGFVLIAGISIVETINIMRKGLTNLSEQVGDARSKLNSTKTEMGGIEKTIENVKKDYSLLSDLNNRMKVTKFWGEGFPKIKKNIIESFIPSLEIQANAYLDRFCSSLRLSISIDPFEIMVYDSSGVKRQFDSFSGGESSRIALALSFAFSDLSGKWFGVETDFVLIDEIMDVMDKEGARDLARILKEDGKQALVISHNSGVSGQFDHSITVVKNVDGVSFITGG